jgi:hypothetical protein
VEEVSLKRLSTQTRPAAATENGFFNLCCHRLIAIPATHRTEPDNASRIKTSTQTTTTPAPKICLFISRILELFRSPGRCATNASFCGKNFTSVFQNNAFAAALCLEQRGEGTTRSNQ